MRKLLALAIIGAFVALLAGPVSAAAVRVAAAGDIAQDPDTTSAGGYEEQSDTATLVKAFIGAGDYAFAMGDTQYEHGNGRDYKCGLAGNPKPDPSSDGGAENGDACGSFHDNEGATGSNDDAWGDFKSQIFPVPGNHEWQTNSGTGGWSITQEKLDGYYGYFGTSFTTNNKPWYTRALGNDWRAYFIDSLWCNATDTTSGDEGACENFAGTADDGLTYDWLEAELESAPLCTILVMHEPRWATPASGGAAGSGSDMQEMRDIYNLFDVNGGGDLVLSGSQHWYERFSRMDADGGTGVASNPMQIVAGAGGEHDMAPDSWDDAEHRANQWGVFKLKLYTNNGGPNGEDFAYQYETGAGVGSQWTDPASGFAEEQCHLNGT
jgi:hypothetical protein